jgi:hypothetical protein
MHVKGTVPFELQLVQKLPLLKLLIERLVTQSSRETVVQFFLASHVQAYCVSLYD